MRHIPASLRRAVIERAGNRCEYCQLAQAGQEATFHIDHVLPLILEGSTSLENLALACVSCSLRKGPRISVPSHITGELVPIFNPREHSWDDHFLWQAAVLESVTPVGSATIELLKLNRPLLVAIRELESTIGRHPP